jgi:hypothetical protein
MLDKLKSFFIKADRQAAAALPDVVEPKVPNKPQAKQSFSKRTATSTGDQKLISTDRRTANLDILSLATVRPPKPPSMTWRRSARTSQPASTHTSAWW